MKTQTERERIVQIIRKMPEAKLPAIVEAIDETDEDLGAPEDLEIKDKKELEKFLRVGIDAAERGEVCPLEEVFSELDRACS